MDTPPPLPGQPPEKKGLSKLACFGIGCGALGVVAVIAIVISLAIFLPVINQTLEEFAENPDKAVAEWMAKLDGSVEFIESDPEAGTISVRVVETGEVITIPFARFTEEDFSIADLTGTPASGADASGMVAIDTVDTNDLGDGRVVTKRGEEAKMLAPEWVQPILELPETEVETGVLAAGDGKKTLGTITLTANEPPQTVAPRFKAAMEAAGMQVSENPSPDFRSIRLESQTPDGPLTVECLVDAGGTAISVTFQIVAAD